ncbi:hypothetical protein GT354_15095, partial [Streptomyces sp. SID3343]|nr:hypothetical protein [Streptomyces sp. SID3343]
MPRTIIRAAVPAGLAVALVWTLSPSALADDPVTPAYPGADRVRQAQDEAGRKADGVDRIEADLDREAADLAQLDIRAGAVVEAYNGAVVVRGQARDEAARAEDGLRTADLRLTQARDELGRIAAQAYRSGGGSQLGVFQALMGGDSPGDALSRVETARRVAHESDESVKRASAVLRDAATA